MSNFNVTWIDDFEENTGNLCSEIPMKPQEIFHYKEDPLGVIIWYKTEERNGYTDFFSFLKRPDNIDYERIPSKYLEESHKIRSYYKNKLMLRRLRNAHMSDFMKSLERILDKPNELSENDFRIVIKLLDFYKEDTETDKILKNAKSLDTGVRGRAQINEVFEFAGSVERKSRTQRTVKYYFKNSKDNVLAVDVRKNDISYPAFEYIAKSSKRIGFKAVTEVHPVVGRDFNCWHLGVSYELYDPGH